MPRPIQTPSTRTTLIVSIFLVLTPALLHAQAGKPSSTSKPDHAILFVIDGLSYKVWDKLSIPTLRKLAREGVLVEKDYLPPPAHPQTGTYAELHTSSIPNPIMMSGTVFITKETGYVQRCFRPPQVTAFVVNATSYTTLNVGYTYSYQREGSDDESVPMALEFMRTGKPRFLRIHLQNPGSAGSESMMTEKNVDWRWNIWAKDSPYRIGIERADSLLGVFLDGLKSLGVVEKTAILVVGDHGQDDGGWHPLQSPDAAITTMVLWGSGVRSGGRILYAEHIDIVPTICALMRVDPPTTSQGRVIAEALEDFSGEAPPRAYRMKELDEQLLAYQRLVVDVAHAIQQLASLQQGSFYYRIDMIKQNFYDIYRFTEWPRFKTIEQLIANNRKELMELAKLSSEIKQSH